MGTKKGLRADQKKARPFLPGIEPRFFGRPARSLVTKSIPPHATVPTKVPLRLHAPCLGKETQGESLRVYDPIGGRRGRYRAGRWETLDLSFCVLGFSDPKDAHWNLRKQKEGIVCDQLELWACYLQGSLVQNWSKKIVTLYDELSQDT
jgi:hypothetical protein